MSESVGTASLQLDPVVDSRERARRGWLVLAVALATSMVIAAVGLVVDDLLIGFALQFFSRCSVAVGCWWLVGGPGLHRGMQIGLRVASVLLVLSWMLVWTLELEPREVLRGVIVQGTPFIVVDIGFWALLAVVESEHLRARHPRLGRLIVPVVVGVASLWALLHLRDDVRDEYYETWQRLGAEVYAETEAAPSAMTTASWLYDRFVRLVLTWLPTIVCAVGAVEIWWRLRHDDAAA